MEEEGDREQQPERPVKQTGDAAQSLVAQIVEEVAAEN
jgi:hypothetical protein